jgi:CheY-like chemotaxis protein
MASPEKPKVLIVDDDPDFFITTELALQDLEVKILKCSDGLAAMEIFEAEMPQIVILDLMLPKRGGFQVLRKLKDYTPPDSNTAASPPKGQLPIVIMVTGNEGVRHQDFAQSLGVDEYLRKPFALTVLVELVSKYLEKLPDLPWVDKYKESPFQARP